MYVCIVLVLLLTPKLKCHLVVEISDDVTSPELGARLSPDRCFTIEGYVQSMYVCNVHTYVGESTLLVGAFGLRIVLVPVPFQNSAPVSIHSYPNSQSDFSDASYDKTLRRPNKA